MKKNNETKEKIIDNKSLNSGLKIKVTRSGLKNYILENKKKCAIILAIAIVAFIVIKSTMGAVISTAEKEKAVAVKVEDLKKKSMNNDVVYGAKIQAEQSVPILLKTSGEVEEVYVNIGDTVVKDQVLFRLDEEALRDNVNSLRSVYNSANASLQVSKANYDSTVGGKSESSIMQAKAQKETLELEFNNFKTTYEATKQLYEAGGVSKAEFDQIESKYKQLEMNVNNAVYSYNLLVNTTIGESKQLAYSQYQQAVSARDSAKLQLDNSMDLLKDANVKSPIDGIVSELNVKANNTLQAGMSPCVIVNMNKLEVRLSVSESVIAQLKKDEEVGLKLSAFPNKDFKGIITGLSPAATTGTSTYPVVIQVNNDEGLIKPGMFAKVYFKTERVEDAIVVPREAVITLGNEKYVFTIDKNKKAKKCLVGTGLDNGIDIQIISGLKENDKLVVVGQDFLSDGLEVNIME